MPCYYDTRPATVMDFGIPMCEDCAAETEAERTCIECGAVGRTEVGYFTGAAHWYCPECDTTWI